MRIVSTPSHTQPLLLKSDITDTMAVPFSRPRQPQRRQRHPAQPQGGRPQQQTEPTYQHPIARFLYGDGAVQLDRVSRLTRITFYALYEAWRLLQDLAPEPQGPRAVSHEPLLVNNTYPRLVPTHINNITNVEKEGRRANGELPDVLPLEDEEDSTQQPKDVEVTLEDITLADIQQMEESHQQMDNSQQLPDLINTAADTDELDAGYFSTNSSLCMEPLDHDHGDVDEAVVVAKDISHDPWSRSGMALIQMASAFDISYGATFENERQRAAYELYQRMRGELLRSHSAAYSHSQSVFDLGKAMLSQALLAGLWYMLKKMA